MRDRTLVPRLSIAVWLAAFATACGDDFPDHPGDHDLGHADPVIGAACRDDFDCLEQCEEGDAFPGGFCTMACREDYHCTPDTVCTDTRDGVCLFPCLDHVDCDFLGPSYYCHERSNYHGQTVFVCLGA